MQKPSASLAVSTLALIVALGGTAGAAGGWINGNRIKPHTITSLQLAAGAVKAPNVAPHSIRKSALADGVIVNNTVIAPAGPQGDPGKPGDTIAGPAGPAGPDGSPKAWGAVAADGTLDLARTHGIASATRVSPNGGYCVTLEAPANVVIVNATPGAGSAPMQATWSQGSPCTTGAYFVRTFVATGTAWQATDVDFSIIAA